MNFAFSSQVRNVRRRKPGLIFFLLSLSLQGNLAENEPRREQTHGANDLFVISLSCPFKKKRLSNRVEGFC